MAKKTLAHNRAVPVMACGMSEKDIHIARATLAAEGHYVLNTRDNASMGIQDPDEKSTTGVTGDPTTERRKRSRHSGYTAELTHEDSHQ